MFSLGIILFTIINCAPPPVKATEPYELRKSITIKNFWTKVESSKRKGHFTLEFKKIIEILLFQLQSWTLAEIKKSKWLKEGSTTTTEKHKDMASKSSFVKCIKRYQKKAMKLTKERTRTAKRCDKYVPK